MHHAGNVRFTCTGGFAIAEEAMARRDFGAMRISQANGAFGARMARGVREQDVMRFTWRRGGRGADLFPMEKARASAIPATSAPPREVRSTSGPILLYLPHLLHLLHLPHLPHLLFLLLHHTVAKINRLSAPLRQHAPRALNSAPAPPSAAPSGGGSPAGGYCR